jgi:hypothetical protein
VNKKKQKNLMNLARAGGVVWADFGIAIPESTGRSSPVFRAYAAALAILAIPLPALAYDNSACWHYAEQQGPRPDITCTPITPALLDSLQNLTQDKLIELMNEPGEPYPDGTLHYTGNDLINDGSYQGTIALTLTAGQVTAITAQLDNPNQGGSYFTYRWTSGGTACSNLPGSQQPC